MLVRAARGWPAVKIILVIWVKMVLLKPTYIIDGDITDIDLDHLMAAGVRGIIFDLDSTLLAPKSEAVSNEVEAWLAKVRQNFRVVILSNNKKEAYVKQAEELFQMPAIAKAAKPRRWGFHKSLEILKLPAEEVVVVGDRPLTDVLGGHRAGIRTVLVRALKTIEEPAWKTFFRNLERCFIKN